MFERGWTDGLPVIPPTADRVEAMLGGADGAVSLGLVPPAMGEATLARAGRLRGAGRVPPGLLPGRGRRRGGGARPGVQPARPGGDHPAGRAAHRGERAGAGRLGLNSGMGALGPGNRANLTIGRALRLLVTLTGGAMPGALDRSTLGHMGKVGFCIAEDEEVSPWEPLHVERGFDPGQSVVTVIGCDAPLSISDHRSRTPEDLAYVLAWAAASTWSTNWWPLAEPSVFVICPEHAEMFRGARLDQTAAARVHVRGGAQACRAVAPRRDHPASCTRPIPPPRCPSGCRRRPSCCSWRAARPGVILLSWARAPAWDSRSSPGRWSLVGR